MPAANAGQAEGADTGEVGLPDLAKFCVHVYMCAQQRREREQRNKRTRERERERETEREKKDTQYVT